MDQLPCHIFVLVLLALALLLTDPFSLTIAVPPSWLLIGGILALAYMLRLERSKPSITPVTIDYPGYQPQPQPQPRLENQAQSSNPQQQNNDMAIWIEAVHSQRNTILHLHDQVIQVKRCSAYLESRLEEAQKKSAAQHSVATKAPNAGDAQKVLGLKQTIVDLTHKLQNMETTFGVRLEESKKMIRPGFEEEVKKNWILLSRYDQWQAFKEVEVWCQNHGLMLAEAGTSIRNDSGFSGIWPFHGGSFLTCLAAHIKIQVEAAASSSLLGLSSELKKTRRNSQLAVWGLGLLRGSVSLVNRPHLFLFLGLVRHLAMEMELIYLLRLTHLLGMGRPVKHLELADLVPIFRGLAIRLLRSQYPAMRPLFILLSPMRLVSLPLVILLALERPLQPLDRPLQLLGRPLQPLQRLLQPLDQPLQPLEQPLQLLVRECLVSLQLGPRALPLRH